MNELSLLQHFIAVAQTRSFTKASLAAHTSQSVVSRSIKRLEDQVGAALFERTTRQVRLTAAGEALLTEAVAIVDRLAVATDNARRIGQGSGAKLRIGICPSADPETPQIARGLNAFRDAWPAVEVQIKATMRNVQAKALRASEIDVGLMLLSRTDCAGLNWSVIARDPLVLVVPTAWRFGKTRIRLDELRDAPWIMPHPAVAPDMHQMQMELCRGAGFEPRIGGLAEDPLTGKMMLACGLGAAFVYDRGVRPREHYVEFVTVEGVSEHFSSETVIAWAAGTPSPHIEAFVESVVAAEPVALAPHNAAGARAAAS